MSEKIANIFVLLGCILMASGFIAGCFMLHWILGIIALGFSIALIAVLFSTDKCSSWDDWDD